jgi:hypothetical protein
LADAFIDLNALKRKIRVVALVSQMAKGDRTLVWASTFAGSGFADSDGSA